MKFDRAISLALACVVIALLVRGDTMEAFGIGMLVGLICGALCGVAFTFREPRPWSEP